MKKHNYLLFSFVAAIAAVGVGLVLAQQHNAKNFLTGKAEDCTHEHVVHYDGVAPTLENTGRPEHWACCDCGRAWYNEALTEEIVGRQSNPAVVDFAKKTAMTPISKADLDADDKINNNVVSKVKWTDQNDIVNSPKASTEDRMEYYSIDGRKAIRFSFDYDGLSDDDKSRIKNGTTDPSGAPSTGGNVANAGYTEIRFAFTGTVRSFSFDYKYWDLNRDVYDDGGVPCHTMAQAHDTLYNYEEMNLVNDNQWHTCTVLFDQVRTIDFATLKIQHFHGEIFLNNMSFEEHTHNYTYSYDETSGKIIHACACGASEQITPTQYVSKLVFHANNNNVAQFKVGSLTQTADGAILNPESVATNLNINTNTLSYYGDSLTVGFYKTGAFVDRARGDHILLKNTIVKVEDNYYVIGRAGCVYSDVSGHFQNVTGSLHNELLNTSYYNTTIYFDLKVDVDLSQWSITDNNVGETWCLGGGASWQINRIREGVESEFVKFGLGSTNGQTPEGLTELTVQTKSGGTELAQKYVRIGFNVNYLQEGDMIAFKADSILTDDGSGKNAIVLDEEIKLIFDGQTFNHFIGDVDLSTCEGTESWNHMVFRFSCLKFDVVDHDGIKKITLVYIDGEGHEHRNNNTYGWLNYYDNDALHGIMGRYDVDGYTPSNGDRLEIRAGSFISVGVQTHRVAVGVTFTYNGSTWVL